MEAGATVKSVLPGAGNAGGVTGLPEHPHRDCYDALSSSGRMVLQLHAWDEENHPNLVNRAAAPPGHGVLLWFVVEDFEEELAASKV